MKLWGCTATLLHLSYRGQGGGGKFILPFVIWGEFMVWSWLFTFFVWFGWFVDLLVERTWGREDETCSGRWEGRVCCWEVLCKLVVESKCCICGQLFIEER